MKQPHILILLALLLLGTMIVSPVSARYDIAYTYDTNASEIHQLSYPSTTSVDYNDLANNTGIYKVNVYAPIGTVLNYTLFYGTGSSVTGSAYYISVYPGASVQYVEINGVYELQGFVDLSWLVGKKLYSISYASNVSDTDNSLVSQGFLIYNPGVSGQNIDAYFQTGDINENIITGITISSSLPVDVEIHTTDQDTIIAGTKNANISNPGLTEAAKQWINFAIGIAGTLFGFVLMVFGLIKFFFIDNLLLVVALWISVSMAYSALSSKNIFQFYKKFFHYQRSLLDFFVWLWRGLIEIVSSFRGIFRI